MSVCVCVCARKFEYAPGRQGEKQRQHSCTTPTSESTAKSWLPPPPPPLRLSARASGTSASTDPERRCPRGELCGECSRDPSLSFSFLSPSLSVQTSLVSRQISCDCESACLVYPLRVCMCVLRTVDVRQGLGRWCLLLEVVREVASQPVGDDGHAVGIQNLRAVSSL